MKKVIVISSSFRKDSSSKILALEAMKGIKLHYEVSFLDLSKLDYTFCHGCLACQKTGLCTIKDDISTILDVISQADILVLATPIYYYSISGQLKTFLDRLNPLYVRENNFKEIYTITTCADDDAKAIEGPIKAIEGFASCFQELEIKGSFNAYEINSCDDLTEALLKKAFIFGSNI